MQRTKTPIVMKTLNYDKLMAHQPTEYDRMTNRLGQLVIFYEDPIRGDEGEVLAVFPQYNKAVRTTFFDTEDMMHPDSDYALEIVERGGIDTVMMQYEVKYLK